LVDKGMTDDTVSRAVHRATRALCYGFASGRADLGDKDPKKSTSKKLASKKQTQNYEWVAYFYYGI
jgi:hypothetical protein